MPVVSQSIMKAMVPVGASSVVWALRKPWALPSVSVSSQMSRAARCRSDGTCCLSGMPWAASRCFWMTRRNGSSFLRYSANGPPWSRAMTALWPYASAVMTEVMAAA
jgi:hypothetical protein